MEDKKDEIKVKTKEEIEKALNLILEDLENEKRMKKKLRFMYFGLLLTCWVAVVGFIAVLIKNFGVLNG